ncbi:DUF4345 domain-containing protein [Sphingomonas sp. KR3-1]|uniref:DUF4345 domain-containing protein n=1 Tax=Sphingomonas sp. KR3-1 TaxID=3156611 RepID=UPI0032B6247E
MSPAAEKRLLQIVMLLVLLVPLSGALIGIVRGPEGFDRTATGITLDSHFRYLSGLLLAMVALFASCVAGIERNGARLRLISVLPITGGLARLLALVVAGVPSWQHQAALGIELGVVPLILLWQARLARRF